MLQKFRASQCLAVTVTGEAGIWVQMEVLRSNAEWQNSLQIVNGDGLAITSIGATSYSTNMGNNEIFLSGGSMIKFYQSTNNQDLNYSPNLKIKPDPNKSFMLHLEDSDDEGEITRLLINTKNTMTRCYIILLKLAMFVVESLHQSV